MTHAEAIERAGVHLDRCAINDGPPAEQCDCGADELVEILRALTTGESDGVIPTCGKRAGDELTELPPEQLALVEAFVCRKPAGHDGGCRFEEPRP